MLDACARANPTTSTNNAKHKTIHPLETRAAGRSPRYIAEHPMPTKYAYVTTKGRLLLLRTAQLLSFPPPSRTPRTKSRAESEHVHPKLCRGVMNLKRVHNEFCLAAGLNARTQQKTHAMLKIQTSLEKNKGVTLVFRRKQL